eukprot:6195610-Prymnesium_polylepis.1
MGTRTRTASCGRRRREVQIFKSVDISVVVRASFWYALPHPLSPVTQSPKNTPHSPSLAQFTPLFHPRQALMGDGDSLRRSID